MPTVLHLFANHKITGPAELALETARAVARPPVTSFFVSSDVKKARYRDRWLQLLAEKRGIGGPAGLEPLRLAKHLSPISAYRDMRRLQRFLARPGIDLVHAHLPNDHLIAGLAAARAGRAVPIVRTLYDGEAPKPGRRVRFVLRRHTSRLICLSREVAAAIVARAKDYAIDPARVVQLDPPIDVARFDPARGVASRRQALGVPADAFCLGIVARMQTHRRFDALLEGLRRARAEVPGLHLVIVGRGTKQDEVAREPVKAMGLSDAVTFTGYQEGEDYVGTLAALDAKVFLVPGSDGSCRAVREALSMGLPVIAARRGMLPELVRDGETGLVIDDTPDELARAFVELARDRARTRALGARAREDARARFSFEGYATALARVYDEVLAEARVGAYSRRPIQ